MQCVLGGSSMAVCLRVLVVCGVGYMTFATAECDDKQPPLDWANPTCEGQLKHTFNCQKRRTGNLTDGICSKTCGLCGATAPYIDAIVRKPPKCVDVQPPPDWANPTCEKQLANTNRCEKRRTGEVTDGYCAKTCGVCSDESSMEWNVCTVGDEGVGAGAACIFPFMYKGETYNSCTTVDSDAPWCATEVDVYGNYIEQTSKWGYCGSLCNKFGTLPDCTNLQPPRRWKNPTCWKQLKNTNMCEKRRTGKWRDGLCARTCGARACARQLSASSMDLSDNSHVDVLV